MSHTFDRKGCWVRLDSQEAVAAFRAEYQQQRGWRRLWAKLCDAMMRPPMGTVGTGDPRRRVGARHRRGVGDLRRWEWSGVVKVTEPQLHILHLLMLDDDPTDSGWLTSTPPFNPIAVRSCEDKGLIEVSRLGIRLTNAGRAAYVEFIGTR